MKKLYSLLLLAASLVSIASCNNNIQSDSMDSSSTDTTLTDSSSNSSSDVEVVDEYNVLPDWEETKMFFDDKSFAFSDISVDRAFQTGQDYSLTYEMEDPWRSVHANEQAISSNELVFTTEMTSDGFVVHCLHAGKAYIRILDDAGRIRYCALIRVTDKISVEDMEEYLYDCEYFVDVFAGLYGGDYYILTFFLGGKYTLSGAISNVPIETINGTYEFQEELNGGLEYRYIFTDNDCKAYDFTGFDIACNGEMIYLQCTFGTDTIMIPKDKADKYFNN